MRINLFAVGAFAVGMMVGPFSAAHAASVTCGTANRVVTVSSDGGTPGCLLNTIDQLGYLFGNPEPNKDGFVRAFPDYILLDTSTISALIPGAIPGFEIEDKALQDGNAADEVIIGPLIGKYSALAVGYQFLQEVDGVKAMVFSLPDGVPSGSTSINISAPAGQTVSWATLYGIPVAPVPLPAAAWLLLSGVAGLAALGRRRTVAA